MDPVPRELLERVVARAAELREPGVWDAETADRRAAVVRWRSASSSATEIVNAIPFVARRRHGRQGRWLEPDEEPTRRLLVGFDAQDQPLIVVDEDRHVPYIHHSWRYTADHVEETHYHGGEPHVTWLVEG